MLSGQRLEGRGGEGRGGGVKGSVQCTLDVHYVRFTFI